jgi:methyl-accepting chemotaxis protein
MVSISLINFLGQTMTLSLKTRWTLSIAISVALSLVILGFTTLNISEKEMYKVLTHQAEQNLTAKKILVKSRISAYFSSIQKQLILMARNYRTLQASKGFLSAYYQYENTQSDSINRRDIKQYYDDEFGRVYYKTNAMRIQSDQLASKLSPNASALQADYLARNSFDLGSKDSLTKIGNTSAYDEMHANFHPDFAAFVNTFDFYDLFIVDAKTGDVVYSVFKEVDFATNLNNGSFSNSGLAESYQNAKSLSQGEFYLTDFASYKPSYEAPAGFISTPVYDGNKVIAVLIFQMPIDAINNTMTLGGKWADSGFGETGEVYLVGPDMTLRSESRFYVQDPQAYVRLLEQLNMSEVKSIEAKDTTITLQKVNSVSTIKALAGETGFNIIKDYRGVDVLSAYSPIKFGNLSWAVISEIDEQEAFDSAYSLEKKLSYITVLGILILTAAFSIFALIMVSKLIMPLVNMGKHFQTLTSGEADLTITVPRSRIPEVNEVSQNFNTFVGQLSEIINEIKTNSLVVAAASEELSVSTEQSSRAAEYQRGQAQEVMQAINDFDTSVSVVSEHSHAASKGMTLAHERTLANGTKSSLAAQKISLLVDEVNNSAGTILQLKDEVQNINDVLIVINRIADQTNLLALNAAIEAARAGEHGRGFSVVADEVRTLASSTQKSTVDIQEKIKTLTTVAESAVSSMERASQSATQGVELVQGVNNSLLDMTSNIEELAEINQQVASASSKQAETSGQINQNMQSVNSASGQMSIAASESKQAARELSHISSSLQSLVERFVT